MSCSAAERSSPVHSSNGNPEPSLAMTGGSSPRSTGASKGAIGTCDPDCDWGDQGVSQRDRAPSQGGGLSIGVQSSWADYRFVFERKEAQPLKRWVKHFGYSDT